MIVNVGGRLDAIRKREVHHHGVDVFIGVEEQHTPGDIVESGVRREGGSMGRIRLAAVCATGAMLLAFAVSKGGNSWAGQGES